MTKRIGKWILYLLLVTLVLTIEQLYGLPLVFFALTVLAASAWGPWFKQAWLLVVGVLLAALYGLPLAGGVMLLVVAYGAWLLTGSVFKNTTVRLVVIGLVAALLLALVTQFIFTTTTFLLLIMSSLIVVILTRVFVFAPESSGAGNFIRQFREVRIKSV